MEPSPQTFLQFTLASAAVSGDGLVDVIVVEVIDPTPETPLTLDPTNSETHPYPRNPLTLDPHGMT